MDWIEASTFSSAHFLKQITRMQFICTSSKINIIYFYPNTHNPSHIIQIILTGYLIFTFVKQLCEKWKRWRNLTCMKYKEKMTGLKFLLIQKGLLSGFNKMYFCMNVQEGIFHCTTLSMLCRTAQVGERNQRHYRGIVEICSSSAPRDVSRCVQLDRLFGFFQSLFVQYL